MPIFNTAGEEARTDVAAHLAGAERATIFLTHLSKCCSCGDELASEVFAAVATENHEYTRAFCRVIQKAMEAHWRRLAAQ